MVWKQCRGGMLDYRIPEAEEILRIGDVGLVFHDENSLKALMQIYRDYTYQYGNW